MAEITPPSYLQNGAASALSDRLTISGLLQPGGTGLSSRGGVRATSDGNGLAVRAAATANNTVIVGAGTAFVVESDGTGVYVCHNDADKTLTVPAASTTQSRRDLVVAQVRDSTISGTSDDWVITTVTGTPSSGTPVAPAVPANALALGDYLVPAGSSTVVTSANINDRRSNVSALGGVMSVLSTALPVNPYRGMTVWCTDTEDMRVYNGASAGWRVQSFYPLPDPVKAYYNDWETIASAASVWARFANRVSITYTAPKPMWVLITVQAWMRAIAPTEVRAVASVTGATTGPGTSGVLIESGGNWGDALQSSIDSTSIQCSSTVPFKLNAGSHTIEIYGMRINTTATPSVNYPVLRVTPLRYA
jgi:hypothetical protein